MNPKKIFMLLALVFLAAVGIRAAGDGNGFMIGVFVPYNTFGGHFDGDHFYEPGGELLIVPKMEKALGYGLAAGSRRGDMEWELYYMHSNHDWSFTPFRDKATFDAVGLNSRFFIGRHVIKPFVNLGMDYCWLKAQNASMTIDPPVRTGAVKYTGLGLIGGGGLGICPVRAVTLYVGAEIRWSLFGHGTGVLGHSYKLDKLNSLSICLRSGLNFVI